MTIQFAISIGVDLRCQKIYTKMLDDVKSLLNLLLKIKKKFRKHTDVKCQHIHYIDKVKVMNNVSGSVPVPKSKGPFW